MSSVIQFKRGTAAEWTSVNPTLAAGEAGFETDTKKIKVGNGSSSWTALSYIATDGDIAGVTAGTGLSGGGTSGTVTVNLDTASVYVVPSQSTHSGKYLTTNGTSASWAAIDLSAYAPISLTTNAQTASYALVLADAYKVVEMNVGSGNTLTVPLNSSHAFPVGTQITVIQTGSGQTTLAGTAGVTVNSKDGNLKIAGQWASATLIKRATDTWVAIGNLSA